MGSRVAVLGASGFAGGELLRILARHPGIQVAAAAASANLGRRLAAAYPAMTRYHDLTFLSVEETLSAPCDLVFSSLPHTESMKLFSPRGGPKVVDLAGDFRLKKPELYPEWYGQAHAQPEALGDWIYGLTELHRDEVKAAERVANPGCYAAAALLALAPLVEQGLVDPSTIVIDAKSGVSGAGRASGEGFAYSAANENVRPYAVTGHKHVPEIEQELSALAESEVRVTFVPHLVPMTRGILATCVARAVERVTDKDLLEAFRERYQGEPFIRVLGGDSLPETKRVAGTNVCEVAVRLDVRTGRVIAMSAIDNLGKGAAGQAVQNANLMLGFDETTALDLVGLEP